MYSPIEKNYRLVHECDIYLCVSTILEVFSTICLDHSKNNTFLLLPVLAGYILSYYLFTRCLDKYSLGTAYTIWSCVGVVITIIYDCLYYSKPITYLKVVGIITIVSGLCVTSYEP